MPPFDFGDTPQPGQTQEQNKERVQRSQIAFPLDVESKGALKIALQELEKEIVRKRNRVQMTLAAGVTSFVVSSDYMVLTGDAAANTIATIDGGQEGQILTLEFTDAKITLTDDATGTLNTINIGAAFTSTANDVMQLLFNGTSWREVSRSVN